jgi:hypothetical protein
MNHSDKEIWWGVEVSLHALMLVLLVGGLFHTPVSHSRIPLDKIVWVPRAGLYAVVNINILHSLKVLIKSRLINIMF